MSPSHAPAAALDPGPASPCVRQCCLDDGDECIGCGRTLDEIKAWHAADAEGREAILRAAAARRAARSKRYAGGAEGFRGR